MKKLKYISVQNYIISEAQNYYKAVKDDFWDSEYRGVQWVHLIHRTKTKRRLYSEAFLQSSSALPSSTVTLQIFHHSPGQRGGLGEPLWRHYLSREETGDPCDLLWCKHSNNPYTDYSHTKLTYFPPRRRGQGTPGLSHHTLTHCIGDANWVQVERPRGDRKSVV